MNFLELSFDHVFFLGFFWICVFLCVYFRLAVVGLCRYVLFLAFFFGALDHVRVLDQVIIVRLRPEQFSPLHRKHLHILIDTAPLAIGLARSYA